MSPWGADGKSICLKCKDKKEERHVWIFSLLFIQLIYKDANDSKMESEHSASYEKIIFFYKSSFFFVSYGGEQG